MSRADYAHWNEEADQVWWAEEGRHADGPVEYDDSYLTEGELSAEDAFGEEVAEWGDQQVIARLCDADFRRLWPKAVWILEGEAEYRQIGVYAA